MSFLSLLTCFSFTATISIDELRSRGSNGMSLWMSKQTPPCLSVVLSFRTIEKFGMDIFSEGASHVSLTEQMSIDLTARKWLSSLSLGFRDCELMCIILRFLSLLFIGELVVVWCLD